MNVFITGATGFIGRRLAEALHARGHEVTCAVRDVATAPMRGARGRLIQADFGRMTAPAQWLPLLRGTDVVVNAVGILKEHGASSFESLHVRAPAALFEAAASAGVQRIVQVSALGADAGARTPYHLSKRTADERLLALPVPAVVVQPSLVYGAGGASGRLFTTLASLPLVPVPGAGGQLVQPVHIDDAVEAIVALVQRGGFEGQRVPLVGPAPVTLAALLLALRGAMGLPSARVLPVPMALVRAAAALGGRLPGVLLDADAVSMLERGNVAPADATCSLLGRPPRAPQAFVAHGEAAAVRTQAQLGWLLPLLRLSVAMVWIATGVLSLGVYPVEDSYALLARTHVEGALAPWALYGAAALDIALGVATLVLRRRRLLWMAQVLLIVFYTALITVFLPEFWLHPYGPLLKNLPMLAALALLWTLEPR